MKAKNLVFLLVVLFSMVSLAGCAVPINMALLAGSVGSTAAISGGMSAAQGKRTSFSDGRVLELKTVPSNILDVAADVGKSLGYGIQRVSRNILNLNAGTSTGAMMVSGLTMGIATKDIIIISLTHSDRGVDYSITMYGKFGDDPVKAADVIVGRFKSKLEERLDATSAVSAKQ